jgi:hypothetical protein
MATRHSGLECSSLRETNLQHASMSIDSGQSGYTVRLQLDDEVVLHALVLVDCGTCSLGWHGGSPYRRCCPLHI